MSVSTEPQTIDVPAVALPAPAAMSALTLVRPIAQPTELIAYHEEVTQLIQKALKPDVDFGVIPGTGKKPSLLKAGAERLNLAFGAAPEFEIIEKVVDHDREVRWTKQKKKWRNRDRNDKHFDWVSEEGMSFGLYTYEIRCKIMRAGRLLAECIGVCSSMESKYIDRPRDCQNTVLKMAQKRALVGATLHAYGLSDRFTQDVEDIHREPQQDSAPFAESEISFGSPPPPAAPPPAAKKSGYDGSDDHAKILEKTLTARKVDRSVWNQIGDKMMGKSFNELDAVIKEVLRGRRDVPALRHEPERPLFQQDAVL